MRAKCCKVLFGLVDEKKNGLMSAELDLDLDVGLFPPNMVIDSDDENDSVKPKINPVKCFEPGIYSGCYHDVIEGLGLINSNKSNFVKYTDLENINAKTIQNIKSGYDYIDTLLENHKYKRIGFKDFTFINKRRNKLEKRVDKIVKASLRNVSLPKQAILSVIDGAKKLVKYKAASEMYCYVDLSDDWGENGDV
eukprot:452162_1